ncbi:MAG: alanine--tRNA ligase, partial [Proteobacteria bacterium]|nr:alanine--tRNA ligase [Pseudomonadota bacterium]
GDYFKEEAIRLAWEYLTEVLKLPKERLLITIFNDDDEAGRIWSEKIGLSPDKVVRCGEKDNFWSMGDTGPCGPCSEIHYDQGPNVGCKRPECNVECDCDRYLEIWNLVFMQSNRDSDGNMSPLPHPSIDTGMGLERLAAVVQGKESNYDTDLFAGIFRHIEKASGKVYGDDSVADISMRVIADHIRAITFLISDGVLPSNEGRGYVLRRIMRRAARHGRKLGLAELFLHLTSSAVADELGQAYPELLENRDFCAKVILNEEERFLNTLDHGMRLLEDEVGKLKKESKNVLPGDIAFRLYDTFGFPLDLTEDILKEEDMTVDKPGFDISMDKQKHMARQAWSGSGESKVDEVYAALVKEKGLSSEFIGYTESKAEARVVAIICDGKSVASANKGSEIEIVTDRTVFYGESGGQKGDAGVMTALSGEGLISIMDTKKPIDRLIVHRGVLSKGSLKVGDDVSLELDVSKRLTIARNHTATHLLQAALKQVLGDHVKQAGSMVESQRLRFDFTHFTAPSSKDIRRVEGIVNRQIWENKKVETENLSIDDAKAKGATALFGEKYGDEVRVVTVPGISMELCGGTHVDRIGEIGPFKIISEGGIAAGVRRIEAQTSEGAYETAHELEAELQQIAALVKGNTGDLSKKIEAILQKQKALESEVGRMKEKLASSGSGDLMGKVVEIKGLKVLSTNIEGADGKTLRGLMDQLKVKIGSGIIVLGAAEGEKVSLIAGVTEDLTDRFNAGKIVGAIAPVVGGKGGGRPDMAQAGGKEPARLDEALKKVFDIIA